MKVVFVLVIFTVLLLQSLFSQAQGARTVYKGSDVRCGTRHLTAASKIAGIDRSHYSGVEYILPQNQGLAGVGTRFRRHQ